MRTFHPSFLLAAALMIGLVACQREQEQGATEEELAPEATSAPEPAPATERTSYQLVVTNPMPHAMNVTVTLPDGSQDQLGTVPASGETSFTFLGAPGSSVTVVATDDGATHSPSGTLTLPVGDSTVRWTVQ